MILNTIYSVTQINNRISYTLEKEYNSIPRTMNTSYSPTQIKSDSNNEDTRIPAFMDDPQHTDESKDNPIIFGDEDSNGDSSDGSVITFGDDLDVPAFIRKRQE